MTADLLATLRRSWDDHRLSRGEGRAIELIASQLGADGLAAARAQLFGVARAIAKDAAALPGAPALPALLDWLEGALAALDRAAAPRGAGVASEVWFAPHQDVCGRVMRAFDEARASVDVCVFTITDDRIANALLAAHRRGVKIRIASDDMKSGDLGSDIERIAKAGVAVRIDRSEAHMHHKFAIFDGRVLLNGSYNWTRSACSENQENCVLTDDARLVEAFGHEFERIWNDAAVW
ncbi:MAG: phospholipase D-like domain-containing protein [Myxococcota bacterium]